MAASLLLAAQGAIRTEVRARLVFFNPDLEALRPEEDHMSDELNRRNFIEDSGRLAASTAGIATWSALHQFYEMRKGNNHGIGGDTGHGMQFHGTDATLYLDRGGFQVIPERHRTAAITSGSSDQNWPHVQDFLKCVTSRARCISDVETGHISTAVCHLGNISYKLGRKIFWDAPSETIVDQKGHPDAEANALLGREYRKGYELPKVEPA